MRARRNWLAQIILHSTSARHANGKFMFFESQITVEQTQTELLKYMHVLCTVVFYISIVYFTTNLPAPPRHWLS